MTLLATVVATSRQVAATSGRSAKIRLLADCLRSARSEELEIAALYLSGEIRQGRIGVGPSLLRACLADAAANPELQLMDIDGYLGELSMTRGAGSSARRTATLRAMFGRATRDERESLRRLIVGELRQGALAGVMVDAIALASDIAPSDVRRAAMYESNLGALARVARDAGIAGLQRFGLKIMTPVVPMLAQVAGDVDEALELLDGDVAFEWKMDGARIQVHKQGELVRIFTRNLNEVTAAIPEIADAARALRVDEIILDGEAIAYAPTGRPHVFQTTMKRFGRKLDVDR